MKKSDIVFRSEMGRTAHATLNVKVNYVQPHQMAELAATIAESENAPGFSMAWINEHLTDEQRNAFWDAATEDGWDRAKDLAHDFFGKVTVYSEGRSAGWLIVNEFTTEVVASWNAIDVSQWHRFAARIEGIVKNVPCHYLWLICHQLYQPWKYDQENAADKAQRLSGL